jgi:hypothetical protein
MFDIDNLIIAEMKEKIEKAANDVEKTKILLNLTDFSENYPEYKEKIDEYYFEKTGESYDISEHFLSLDDVELISEFASKNDYEKAKSVINKFCNTQDETYDYDTLVAEITKSLSPIVNIDDFEFTAAQAKAKKEKSTENRRNLDDFPFPHQ